MKIFSIFYFSHIAKFNVKLSDCCEEHPLMVEDHEDETRERSLINEKTTLCTSVLPVKFPNKVRNIYFFV